MVILEVNGLDFSYDREPVLRRIDFQLDYGEVLGIVGPNGSGKTTLIKCVNGLLTPEGGELFLGDRDLSKLTRKEKARRIGYVPQAESPAFPSTVFDAVLTGRSPGSSWKPSEDDLSAVSETLSQMELGELALRDVKKLSGGQLRKVLIARAFVRDPTLLSLDEPMASLDLRHQLEVLNTVKDWLTDENAALITFHDLNLAAKHCDKVVVLKEGEVFARGGPEVLTPETIEPVYGVEVEVNENHSTRWIEAKRPLTGNRG